MTGEAASSGALLRTALHSCHLAADARMVDFGGWDMPIQYKTGIRAEHLAVRSGVGVFDLSHMGRLYVRGPDALPLVQWLAANDASRLAPGRAQYSLICNSQGKILDDIIVYRPGEPLTEFLLVVNASNRTRVLDWIAQNRRSGPLSGLDATIDDQTAETAMIGFQGPESERLLQELVNVDLGTLRYYASLPGTVDGRPSLIARTGYTGEDGFEVIVSAADGPAIWNTLLQERGGVTPMACGLGARDTLRLEAGMPLYGHEIDDGCNPFEAGLGRVVKLSKESLSGKAALEKIAATGPTRKLIAFKLTVGGVPRQGYNVLEGEDVVGQVTSGNVSPSLGTPIGMAYVPASLSDPETEIAIEIRGKAVPAKVVTLPFYAHKTKKIAAPSTSRG